MRCAPLVALSLIAWSGNSWAFDERSLESFPIDAKFPYRANSTTSTEFAFGAFWASHGKGLLRINAADNSVAEIIINGTSNRQRSIAVGEGAVWLPDVGAGRIFKVDPATNSVAAAFPVQMLASQGSIGVGFGSVWVVSAEDFEKQLVRLNAQTGVVEATISLPSSSAGVSVAYDRVWVAGTVGGELYQIDPSSNEIVSTTKLGQSPKLMTAGAGSVWVLNLGDGTVQRIDPEKAEVIATIDTGYVSNTGEIAFGDDRIWLSVPKEAALLEIGLEKNAVVTKVPSLISWGLVRYGEDSLWLWVDAIYRLDLKQ
jgi:streptogramin lyase